MSKIRNKIAWVNSQFQNVHDNQGFYLILILSVGAVQHSGYVCRNFAESLCF